MQGTQAVVFAAVHIQNGEFFFQQRNGRQKTAAVLPLRIEFGRRVVGSGHQHHAFVKQVFQQAAEDHGIGDVADVKFVEAQHSRFARDFGGH